MFRFFFRSLSLALGAIAAFGLFGCAESIDPLGKIQFRASELFVCPIAQVEVFPAGDLYVARGCGYAGVFTPDAELIFGESSAQVP